MMMHQETNQTCPQQKLCGYEYTVKRGDSFYLIAQRLGVPLRDLLDANSEINPARLMVGDVLCIPMEEDDAVTKPAQEPLTNATKPTPAPQPSEPAADPEPPAAMTEPIAEPEPAAEPAPAMEPDATVEEAPAEPVLLEPGTPIPPVETTHVVAAGETAADILQAADISLKTLEAANPDVDLDALTAGEMLSVPAVSKPCPNARFYRMEEAGNLEQLALLLDVSVAALLRANPCLRPSDFKAGTVVSLP